MDSLSLLTDLIEQRADREQIYQQICITAADLVPSANQIGLWNFAADLSKVQNILTYDVDNQRFEVMDDLHATDYPEYFKGIIENELLVAHDAHSHSMTRCFKDNYLQPNQIFSLLDFILHKNGRPMGIICCESKGRPAQWKAADQENLRMLAVMISYYFTI